MKETQSNGLSVHYILIGVVIIALIGTWYFWPQKESQPRQELPAPTTEPLPSSPEPVVNEPPSLVDVTEEPISTEPDPLQQPEPEVLVDTSDATVKTKLLELVDDAAMGDLLVDQDLLQRFAVNVKNLANRQLANNHQLLRAPQQPFTTYKQGDKEWIDAASFKRYDNYANTLAAIPSGALLKLFKLYNPAVTEYFSEIARPGESVEQQLLLAIDHLLDTPETPMPIEVYTDSVMFKYRNPVLEQLSAPQKQLLRTGPDNLRKIKSKLREIKAELQADGSE